MIKKNPKLDLFILIFIVLAFSWFSFQNLPFTEKLEGGIYSIERLLMKTDERNADKIVLIDIDEKSIEELGSWPWQRRVIADLITKLGDSGAKAIGLNLPLYERESDDALREIKKFIEKYRAYPPADRDPALKKWVLENLAEIEKRLDNERMLIDSIKKAENIILPVKGTSSSPGPSVDKAVRAILNGNYLRQTGLSSSLNEELSVKHLICPYDELLEGAAGLGHVNLNINNQVLKIFHPVFLSYETDLIPSFSLRMALFFFDQTPESVSVENDRILIGEKKIPLVKGRILSAKSSSSDIFSRFSFSDILKDEKNISVFEDKIVIIGFSESVGDQTLSATDKKIYGSLNIAVIIKDIINERAVSRPGYIFYLELSALILLSLVLLFFFDAGGQSFRTLGIACIILITLITSISFLLITAVWFKSVYIICAVIILYIYLSIRDLFFSAGMDDDTRKAIRLEGLNFQNQGFYDLAYDRFTKLPLDKETKDLIYNLGLEYEKKGMTDRALTAFEYINKGGGYRGLDRHISELKALEFSSTMGVGYDPAKETTIVNDNESETPEMVGRYEIECELGKGSMGIVYKAQDPKINRTVAIKTIRFSDEFDEDVIQGIKERFFREAEIAGKLSHPAIVTVHDVGDDEDVTYMAMEFLEGQNLENFIRKGNLLPLRKVLDIVAEIAGALDFAHKADVIHRDIKPANVMLLNNGHVKVTDFGIAKAISSSRTKTGVILGTPNYMSPEQIMGQKIDLRSDIFSLGVLFYQLLTGELPFHGDNLSGLLYQITQVKHTSPRSYNPKIPKVCEQILDRAMEKPPDRRFKSAGDMARIIRLLADKIDQIRKAKAF